MSTKVNHALFDLVKSMTKSEKRYFKLLSSRHTIGEENNYIRLFDYLEKQEAYDEEKLFIDFQGECFLNRFSITKKRLYDHILSALDAYHTGHSLNAQLYRQLHSAEILFEKSLYDQCRRILTSAEKMAVKHERSEILLQIARMKRNLHETIGSREIENEAIDEIDALHTNAMAQIEQFNQLWKIKSDLFNRLQKKGVARTAEEIDAYKTMCSTVLAIKASNISGSELRYLYNHILSAYFYAVRNLQKSLEFLQLNLEELASENSILSIETSKQIAVYTNAIYIANRIGDHRIAICYLNRLKTFIHNLDPNEDQEIKLFSSISSIELSLKVRMGEFNEALGIVPDVIEKLNAYGDKINPTRRAFLSYKIAVAYMGTGNLQKALKWVNTILNDVLLDKTEDIIGFTQLIDLLLHIELDNKKLLPYKLKSTQRFFKTRNRMYDFEKTILDFVSRLNKCDNPFEANELWGQLFNELQTIAGGNELECTALEYFDFLSWAESKLKQKDFAQIVREKYYQTVRQAS